MELLNQNHQTIEKELNWFSQVIETRFKLYFKNDTEIQSIFKIEPPDLSFDNSIYAQLIKLYSFKYEERLILIASIIPHIKPQLFDIFFTKNKNYDRGFTEFGGIKGVNHSGFLPTGETISFILAGNDLNLRLRVLQFFEADHIFSKKNILKLNIAADYEPLLSGVLQIENDYLELLTTGKTKKPNFNEKFPARLIETHQSWDDLILEDQTMEPVNEMISWIKNKDIILNSWDLKKKIKLGYRSLFYGPPGTGKTLTASLIGKTVNRDVYKIDLSMVVSKWVGETEKNLARIFDLAEHKDWILFFDEADALFGKRTNTSSSNEKYANQEVSYLLQRTEDYPGVIILASNLKGNIDDAFTRRFQSIIYFPIPKQKERLILWKSIFNCGLSIDKEIDFNKISIEYEISGGEIINILKSCVIKAAERKEKLILKQDLTEALKREIMKEGKTI